MNDMHMNDMHMHNMIETADNPANIASSASANIRYVNEDALANDYDIVIVGSGFAGAVAAERLAVVGNYRVLVIEKRAHVAGNAYDYLDEHGVLVHRFGPHIFHTNSQEVFDYLSMFTAWRQYEHRVLAWVRVQHLPFPINRTTINRLYGWSLTEEELVTWLQTVRENITTPQTAEESVVGAIGQELYELFFKGYTEKQWGLSPSQLDASVAARVPMRTNTDDRYFTDKWQCMPTDGYTALISRMLSHPRIDVMLDTDYHEVADRLSATETIYTGPVDRYFDFCFGPLAYRSLNFRMETHEVQRVLPSAVVNFPNDHEYTRVTEFTQLTGQELPVSTLMYEYPTSDGDPFYPIPRPENAEMYERYRQLAAQTPNVHFSGRLGTYRYYNMDQVVAQSLTLAAKLLSQTRRSVSATPAAA